MNVAEELRSKGIEFSETAQQELQVLGEALREIMDYAYRSFTAVDAQTARRIEPVEEVVDDMVATLRTNHIRRLREKIEKNPSEPKYVHTKWGVGYYFRG